MLRKEVRLNSGGALITIQREEMRRNGGKREPGACFRQIGGDFQKHTANYGMRKWLPSPAASSRRPFCYLAPSNL